MKIFIDAGHNAFGADTGASGNGIREQDITFLIADKLKNLLVSNGHEVFMSRNSLEDNVGSTLSDSLNTRVNLANRYGAQFFISIHCNAFNGEANGTETLVYSFDSEAGEYAKRIQKAITQKLGTKSRGVKERKDLAVLKKTLMPAVLVETAFIDNQHDAMLLKERQSGFAEAIFEGITGSEYTSETYNLVSEFSERGIITDKELWRSKFEEDKNVYFLAKKTMDYMKRGGM
ncbi:MAG: N-acetylmuramoyl-L-alanine amidase [Ruminococcaceae bacterium]|nr:N-acetylmuramoyl-L-alanine amidase [Oscillospiraceae bacterium]